MSNKKKLDEFIEETITNIRSDRDTVKYLLTGLLKEMVENNKTHQDVGLIAAKYVETLQRSNEQLAKMTGLIQKETSGEDKLSLQDKRDLFDLINSNDDEERTKK